MANPEQQDLSGGNPFKNKDGRYKTITQMKGEPIGDALDYSFVGLSTVEEMKTVEPVGGKTKAMAAETSAASPGRASSRGPLLSHRSAHDCTRP